MDGPVVSHARRTDPGPLRLPRTGRSARRGSRVKGGSRVPEGHRGATALCGARGPRTAPPLTRPARPGRCPAEEAAQALGDSIHHGLGYTGL